MAKMALYQVLSGLTVALILLLKGKKDSLISFTVFNFFHIKGGRSIKLSC